MAAVLLLPRLVSPDVSRLIEADDAYVARGTQRDSWTIGNTGISFSLSLDKERTLVADQLSQPNSGRTWLASSQPDTSVKIGGRPQSLSARTFQYDDVAVSARGSGVELSIRFHIDASQIRISRHYACYPGAPVIETWTTYESMDPARTVAVQDLDAFQFALRSGVVRWVTGLQTPPEQGGTFTLAQTSLDDGASLELGSTGRASEQALPWFTIEAPEGNFFGGLLWAGAWRLQLQADAGTIRAALALQSFTTTTGPGPLETPHAYFGVTAGSTKGASEAMRVFIQAAVRGGRPLSPLVTYNTWFAYGTAIDEGSLTAEIESAADLGVELFVVDAGWYKTSDDPSDFTTGIGVWEEDTDRFPSGLAALSDLAHQRGMLFGIWVEPERVDLATVSKPGLARERWLATRDGRYDPSKTNAEANSAQICFADSAVRDWIIARLSRLIDDVHPDYLKWDNNFWLNCNRPGHGHGADDGNFAHTRGLQQVLAALRARYPDLLIENCSGGGNRMEPSMLAYTDSAWMDDRSLSGTHVRHDLEGLSLVMPPASLLSFVFNNEWAGDPETRDIPLAFRSRMPGALGATWRSDDLDDAARGEIASEIAIYKSVRDALTDASASLLTAQVDDAPAAEWDVLQEQSGGTGLVVIFAFENPDADSRVTVRPLGLDPGLLYEVYSVDVGQLGVEAGSDLMVDGFEVLSSPQSRGHVIELRPLGAVSGGDGG